MVVPDFPHDTNHNSLDNSNWQLKEYTSIYLDLQQRKNLITIIQFRSKGIRYITQTKINRCEENSKKFTENFFSLSAQDRLTNHSCILTTR